MCSWFIKIFFLSLLNIKFKMPPFSDRASRSPFLKEALFWSCPPAKRIPKRPYFPLPLSILAGTNLIMLLLLLLFFATPVWLPRKSIPHSISGKFHPRLISEKIQAKTPRKTKKMVLLLPVFSGSVLGVSLLLCHWI